jgi:polyvinyl alcohol dehydrogenase (cytochrome)
MDRHQTLVTVAHAPVRAASRLIATLGLAAVLLAADPAALYKQHCSACHDASGATRAPSPAALKLMSAENIFRALDTGTMKDQAAKLSTDEKHALSAHLGAPAPTAAPKTNACAAAPFTPSAPAWTGWGSDLANTRFQPADTAGLTAADAPRLRLKWAFAFPNTFAANAQPVVSGGRVFVAGANRQIYSLDAKTGCQHWSFEPEAPVRTAIVIAGKLAFFGDQRANAYAVDASTGALVWKTRVDPHPRSKIVGAPAYFDGRLFVPVTAGEEGPAMSPTYECCTGRGSLVALDAATGKQLWKTYTIADEPHQTGKNQAGTATWGPSGASIWSAPTIDAERRIVYVGTGDNFSDPPTATSDAVLAISADTGKILWTRQLTTGDAFHMGCVMPGKPGCPESNGPDFDIGASPILVKLADGRRVLLVSQKSGVARGLNAETGAVLWEQRVGKGGALGGIQWGSASDGKRMFAAVSDIAFTEPEIKPGRPFVADAKTGGGLFALDAATGRRIWSAAPPDCGTRAKCSPAQSAAVSAIPGVVFSGAVDGHLRAYDTAFGNVIWDFDTGRDWTTVNGVPAKGGAMDGPGPAIAGGMLFVCSGYGAWGGAPGNVLLAFGKD